MKDIIDIIDNNLAISLSKYINMIDQHIKQCTCCGNLATTCSLAKNCQMNVDDLIYAYDIHHIFRCLRCDSLYHKQCYQVPNSQDIGCPQCQIIKNFL